MVLIEATPTGYKEKGSFQIPDVNHPSWSHPVVLDGRLYLREQDTLNVYDVRRKS
jgi:outer membrane protein assembly factor BamB